MEIDLRRFSHML